MVVGRTHIQCVIVDFYTVVLFISLSSLISKIFYKIREGKRKIIVGGGRSSEGKKDPDKDLQS